MADIPNRDDLEGEYAREISRILRRLAGNILEGLGDPPDLANLDESFWEQQSQMAMQVLVPFAERIFLEAAKRLISSNPVGVEWDLIHERAVTWARSYTFQMVTNLSSREMRFLRRVIPQYFAEGQTIGELQSRLTKRFDPVRAEMIAVTEVTRAAAQGELETLHELSSYGINMIVTWQTNNDELVCPICGPRNNKPINNGWSEPPPAHPRCRCWLDLTLPKR